MKFRAASREKQIIGCLFNWKQAIRRWMLKNGLSEGVVSHLMTPGELDLLCYLDTTDVIPFGIPYLKEKYSNYAAPMEAFWSYFEKTWVTGVYDIDLWNISRFKNNFDSIQNRTNNALERYNRTMNDLFGHRTPSLPVFVDKIKEACKNILQKLEDIKNKRCNQAVRELMGYLKIPEAFYDFKARLLGR